MPNVTHSNPRAAATSGNVAAALLVAAALAVIGVPAAAAGRALAPLGGERVEARPASADVEREFWRCDFDATTGWVGLDEGAACGAIFEQLKASRFGGDFRAMLDWWQQHKVAEHRALAASSRRAAAAR